jgi:glutathione-regulated potassium-efflux system protein KefB
LVIALDDMDASVKTAQMVRRKFPHLKIIARARNRHHVHLLMNLGIDQIIRETYYSSLRLTELTMAALGIGKLQADRAIELFEVHDERILQATHEIANDEGRLIQTTQEAAQELMELFESDREFK